MFSLAQARLTSVNTMLGFSKSFSIARAIAFPDFLLPFCSLFLL